MTLPSYLTLDAERGVYHDALRGKFVHPDNVERYVRRISEQPKQLVVPKPVKRAAKKVKKVANTVADPRNTTCCTQVMAQFPLMETCSVCGRYRIFDKAGKLLKDVPSHIKISR